MHIWVTRPIKDAATLRAQLIAQGHEVTVEPLLRIEHLLDEPIELDEAQALIATSRNALRALEGRPEADAAKEIPLFVVGRGTAQVAQSMGFETIIEGPSNASALLGLILNTASINDGTLVHLSAENVAYNLCEELRSLGYHVFQPILYRSVKVEKLSEGLLRNYRNGKIKGVMLLSGRTSQAYAALIQSHDLLPFCRNVTHFCLSDSVASRLAPVQPINVKLADAPNIDDLLALTASVD